MQSSVTVVMNCAPKITAVQAKLPHNAASTCIFSGCVRECAYNTFVNQTTNGCVQCHSACNHHQLTVPVLLQLAVTTVHILQSEVMHQFCAFIKFNACPTISLLVTSGLLCDLLCRWVYGRCSTAV